jgi:acyl-CoA reductase-like NAD-dependent aldehyde dehydrogenase
LAALDSPGSTFSVVSLEDFSLSPYGSYRYVWTKDLAKGQALADRVNAGSTCVNDANVNYAANELPFRRLG